MNTELETERPAGLWAVVPAAGLGRRMGAEYPKQYLTLLGMPVIAHTLLRLSGVPGLQAIIVALHPQDLHWQTVQKPDFPPIVTVDGGEERCHSVYNGLLALDGRADDRDWVLVHDAARPCVRIGDIESLLTAVQRQDAGGLLAARITDTVKRGDGGVAASIIETVDRSNLWRALTPQVFRYAVLRQALKRILDNGERVTDEAQAVERMGQRPLLVEGESDNIKITHPQDLPIAEFYLRRQTAG